MVVETIKFKYKNKNYSINAKVSNSFTSKAVGLMFKNNSPPLLFIFKKPNNTRIHSFFCKPFIAIWFFENKIVDIRYIKPNKFSIKSKERFNKLLEIPFNNKLFRYLSTEANI